MYFRIYDSYRVKNLKLKGQKSILIRCLSKSEYSDHYFNIENINEYSNILQLDIKDDNFFDLNNARLLNEFIINNDFDEVITHCALGLSRSPAIMICIAKILKIYELEQLIKENNQFYNKSIVDNFDKYPYKIKSIKCDELELDCRGKLLKKSK